MELSLEQKKIIKKARKYNIAVDCVVGSGKTTTILEIAKDQKDVKFLLLVYNRRLRSETISTAKSQSINNIDIHSFHSYCYHYLNKDITTDYDILNILKNKELVQFNGNKTNDKTNIKNSELVVGSDVKLDVGSDVGSDVKLDVGSDVKLDVGLD